MDILHVRLALSYPITYTRKEGDAEGARRWAAGLFMYQSLDAIDGCVHIACWAPASCAHAEMQEAGTAHGHGGAPRGDV